MPEPDPLQFVTPDQAAAKLQVVRGTIYNLLKAGELESITVGTSRRITLDSLHAYVQRQLEAAKAKAAAATEATAAS